MNKNLKLFLGSIYIFCLCALLYIVFSYFDLKDLTSYTFIKDNSKILIDFKNTNIAFFTIVFFCFSVIWILLLGFGSPIAILSGFIFGQWAGTILTAVSFTIGSSLLYKIAQYYFSNFIVNNFSNRIEKYKFFFKQDELLYFFIFRLTGGAGIPFAIQNVLPVIFDMKIKNYIISTLFGLLPTIFIFNSLGSGIQILIGENDKIDYLSLISRAEIYLPILGFLIIIILSFFGRRYIFKEKK